VNRMLRLRNSYKSQLAVYFAIAIIGWVGYLVVFQNYFPNSYDPSESRNVLWAWLTGASAFFVLFEIALFRILATPPSWRSSMAIAGIAPALLLDTFATTFFSDWFPASAPHEAVAYSATVLGGSSAMFLVALLMSRASTRQN